MTDDLVPNNPIAVTGMHRSGTSMITRGLHESGLHLIGGDADALLAAADDNPEGFWENKAIVNCNDDLLEAAGGSWDNPPTLLPMAVDDPRVAEIVEPATAALAGLAENDRWGFKDPRLCLTAAFWLDLQPDLRFVVCVRNPLEVALSLKRRNQNSYSLGLSLWERYYESILDLVPVERRIVTHYDTYFLDPAGELGRVCEFAGLDAAPLEVRTDLRHHDVGVSLDEANLGSSLRDLYARLCEEAGAAVPRPAAADEGQVRRLVLDGTVSARHAEQRQKAIERLEDRLGQSQVAEKEARDQLNQARRESETRRVEVEAVRSDHARRFDALEAQAAQLLEQNRQLLERNDQLREQGLRLVDATETINETTSRLEDRQRATLERTNHVGEILDAVHVKLRAVETTVHAQSRSSFLGRVRRFLRRGVGPTRQVAAKSARRAAPLATRTAKATARRLPEPAQSRLHRVRRAVDDGQATKRVKERAARVVDRLPGPAQKAARKGTSAVQRSGALPKAKRVARGVQRRLGVNTSPRNVGRPSARPKKKAAAAPRPKKTTNGRADSVPKGPASFKWQKGYERLVREFVAADASWSVVTPGCKDGVTNIAGRTATAFPSADGAAPAADSLSLIAILESMRLRGVERLVIPEGARSWYQSHLELRDHVGRSHLTVADREAAGAVFDLTVPSQGLRGLLAEVNDLSAGLDSLPAVLDWTGLEIAAELPDYTTFSPAAESNTLAYFDDSVEIVVTTASHELAEATRVASRAVIICRHNGTDFEVERVESNHDVSAGADVVVLAESVTPEVDAAVRARAEELGATVEFDSTPGSIESEIVVVVEKGVVPLPGAIAGIVAATRRAPNTISVGKVLDDHGRIESAGGIVFDDGSIAGIANGTLEVRAPWHEFNRPVCWGAGLLAAGSELWSSLPDLDRSDVVGWSGSVWAAGTVIEYRSGSTALRVGDVPRMTDTVGADWHRVISRRPRRPAELGDGAWRFLLANDDVRSLAMQDDA